MLEEALKSERGKFLLSHISNCEKCYKEWSTVNHDLPNYKHVAKLEEIMDYMHQSPIIESKHA